MKKVFPFPVSREVRFPCSPQRKCIRKTYRGTSRICLKDKAVRNDFDSRALPLAFQADAKMLRRISEILKAICFQDDS